MKEILTLELAKGRIILSEDQKRKNYYPCTTTNFKWGDWLCRTVIHGELKVQGNERPKYNIVGSAGVALVFPPFGVSRDEMQAAFSKPASLYFPGEWFLSACAVVLMDQQLRECPWSEMQRWGGPIVCRSLNG